MLRLSLVEEEEMVCIIMRSMINPAEAVAILVLHGQKGRYRFQYIKASRETHECTQLHCLLSWSMDDGCI